MGTEIKIDTDLFEARVDFLKDAINNVDNKISAEETFEFTNIKSLTEILENLIETIEMIDTYKTLFNEDINTLEDIGESMQEQDEKLAQTSSQAIHDPKGHTPLLT